MTAIPTPIPIPAPLSQLISPETVSIGLPISPIDRIKIMSNEQWEDFILEWVDSLRKRYGQVEKCGGAGDMGRDIIATETVGSAIWDNYQCKHYNHRLSPDDIWLELGKLVYYTFKGEFNCPRRYFFVAPCGAGTKLSNLLRRPMNLQRELVQHWDAKCCGQITSTQKVPLNGLLRTHLDNFDFSIFEALQPLRIIEEHAKTRWHVARFGGGLPPRQTVAQPPTTPTIAETGYVKSLLDAYTDHLKRAIAAPSDLEAEQILKEHFNDSRLEFYSAEALRSFSRDTLPPGEFDKLQGEVHDGIRDDLRACYGSGYARVLAVVKTARSLQLAGLALNTRISTRDRGGICHQLANDQKVKWV